MKCKKQFLPLLLTAFQATASDDWGSLERLSLVANNLNKLMPMMVDQITEAFVVTPHDHEVEFSFRITSLEASEIKNNVDPNYLKSERVNYACTKPDIRLLIDHNIRMRYSYFDKNKKFVMSTVVTKADCN